MLAPAHERDAFVQFEEEGHAYSVMGRADFVSVTTYIGRLFAAFEPDLVIEKMMAGKNWPKSKYFGMDAAGIKQVWKDAADLGTLLHADIEHFYKGEPYENTSPEFLQFLEFDKNKGALKPYRSEWRVFDEEVGIVGTIDMVFERPDGTVDIYDWKRTNQITKKSPWGNALHPLLAHLPDTNYWHYALQLNLYQYLLESKYGLKVSGRYLVCMHPERAFYELVPIVEMQAEVCELLKK